MYTSPTTTSRIHLPEVYTPLSPTAAQTEIIHGFVTSAEWFTLDLTTSRLPLSVTLYGTSLGAALAVAALYGMGVL